MEALKWVGGGIQKNLQRPNPKRKGGGGSLAQLPVLSTPVLKGVGLGGGEGGD